MSEIHSFTEQSPAPSQACLLEPQGLQPPVACSVCMNFQLLKPSALSVTSQHFRMLILLSVTLFPPLCLNNSFLFFMSYIQCHFLQEAFQGPSHWVRYLWGLGVEVSK